MHRYLYILEYLFMQYCKNPSPLHDSLESDCLLLKYSASQTQSVRESRCLCVSVVESVSVSQCG
ncbi:UNVERIFIED_CONTAM: hypothetical protein FKN15_034914 [Acipenser sinensis]